MPEIGETYDPAVHDPSLGSEKPTLRVKAPHVQGPVGESKYTRRVNKRLKARIDSFEATKKPGYHKPGSNKR